MELIEKKAAKEEWKMPRNIRQIGEPGGEFRVLIEDYAYTYLHQIAKANLTCMKTAVLVGRNEKDCMYIQGAMEIEMGQEIESWFSNENWRDIFHNAQAWFDGMEVVGWFLSNPGFPPAMTECLASLHTRNFSGGRYVFLQMDILEKDEVFFCREGGKICPLLGFYVYYEKNDRMQAYMSNQKGGAGIEAEGIARDRTAARFRTVMQEKKEHSFQKKLVVFLYASSVMLVLVILVIGITMVNNYDKIAHMETALHQLSENMEESGEGKALVSEEISSQTLQEPVPEENEPQMKPADQEEPIDEPAEDQEETSSGSAEDWEKPSSESEKEGEETVSEEPVEEALSEAVHEPAPYLVKKGDTLLEICRERYGNEDMVKTICELNSLEDGDKIYFGQTILLP